MLGLGVGVAGRFKQKNLIMSIYFTLFSAIIWTDFYDDPRYTNKEKEIYRGIIPCQHYTATK